MKKQSTPKGRVARNTTGGQFVVGRARFERISAVEGIHLTSDMRSTLDRFERDQVCDSDRRAAIIRQFAVAR